MYWIRIAYILFPFRYNYNVKNEVRVQIWRPMTLPLNMSVTSRLKLVWEHSVTVDLQTIGSLITVRIQEVGWLFEFYILAISKVISVWVLDKRFTPVLRGVTKPIRKKVAKNDLPVG